MNYDKLNVVLSLSSSSYSAPTALGIRQEVERIRDNVFLLADRTNGGAIATLLRLS